MNTGSHAGSTFLNSCLKTPIDPCNNCPAPIYNRSKMYVGRVSSTAMSYNTVKPLTTTTTTTVATETNTQQNCTGKTYGLRYLAKFYESIPDYCDINHLPEEEFYSTLDSLKSTCRELRTKSCELDVCSSISSAVASHAQSSSKKKCASAKNKKSKKPCNKNKVDPLVGECHRASTAAVKNAVDARSSKLKEKFGLKSFYKECENEVMEFKKALKDLEEQLEKPVVISHWRRPKSSGVVRSKMHSLENEENQENEYKNPLSIPKVPAKPNKPSTAASKPECLKKSFSFNDLQSMASSESPLLDEIKRHKSVQRPSKAEQTLHRDENKMSNYFLSKSSQNEVDGRPTNSDIPKIQVQTPSSETCSSRNSHSSRKKKSKNRKSSDQIKIPFNLFDLGRSSKMESLKEHSASTASPMHPVARPNLAATLRAEVSRKKLQELQNNCTYHDRTPQVDWEVRKTPAWKLLALNESHKEILLLRLATRKAEQALQKREYEHNMELMRQRVKSAPLLLEGPSYWGPHVGKLSHNCPNEGVKHNCELLSQHRPRKKSINQSSCASSTRGPAYSNNPSRNSNKLNTLRKIYGNGSTNTSRNTTLRREKSNASEKSRKPRETQRTARGNRYHEQDNENGSADELSSLDRAYL